ncbi:MAG: hypothetical protein NT062_32535 [Proteobacteria bacterium]|nr:hypothetical protein [Pseudomonadota bacterium]
MGALTLSGCFIEWTAGAYHTQQRSNQSGQAYEIGLAIGTYLDSYRTPVAASYAGTHDRSRSSTGDISRYRNNDQQLRVDYTLGQRLARFQPGVVAAVRWGDDSTLVFGDPNSEKVRSLSSQYTLFGGFSYRFVLQPGYAWNDVVSIAVGPAVQRFDTDLGGEFSNTGVQLRLSSQLSPLTVVAGVFGLIGGGGAFASNYHPTEYAPQKPVGNPQCGSRKKDLDCY